MLLYSQAHCLQIDPEILVSLHRSASARKWPNRPTLICFYKLLKIPCSRCCQLPWPCHGCCATGVLCTCLYRESFWNGDNCSDSQHDHTPEPLYLNTPIPQIIVVKLTLQLQHSGTRPLGLPHVEAAQSPSSEGFLLKSCMSPPVSFMWTRFKHGVNQKVDGGGHRRSPKVTEGTDLRFDSNQS